MERIKKKVDVEIVESYDEYNLDDYLNEIIVDLKDMPILGSTKIVLKISQDRQINIVPAFEKFE